MRIAFMIWCCFFGVLATKLQAQQEEFEHTQKEIQTNRVSMITVWEQSAWDKSKFVGLRDSCLFLQKEFDTKGRLIALTQNHCPEEMHFRGDYYTYNAEGQLTAHSRSEYGLGEVEFRGIHYENNKEIDSIMYDQGLKQVRVTFFDTKKRVVRKETWQDTAMTESHDYVYNEKGLIVQETGSHRESLFAKYYKYNSKDSLLEVRVLQDNELVEREWVARNNDGSRKNFYNVVYAGQDSIVQRTHYEYFGKQHLKKVTVASTDEKGVFQLVESTEYDKAGNIVRTENSVDPQNPNAQEYTYTDKHQLKSITWKLNNQKIAEAHYHYKHHLLSKYEYKEIDGLHRIINYRYNRQHLLIEKHYEQNGSFHKKYTYHYASFQ